MAWATVEGLRATGATEHFVHGTPTAGTFSRLAACAYGDFGAAYLFHCDDDWSTVTDTLHDSVEDAMDQGRVEYGTSLVWHLR